MTTISDRTRQANLARQQQTTRKLRQVADALRALGRDRFPITYPAVARRAGVSRTFLYQNPDAAALISDALAAAGRRRDQDRRHANETIEASWRQRALNAEDALRAALQEVDTQRERNAILLGQIRDLHADYTEGTAQRLTTENNTFRQRVRELTEANRDLDSKLQAARSNNRFLDKRLADLEAQIVESATVSGRR